MDLDKLDLDNTVVIVGASWCGHSKEAWSWASMMLDQDQYITIDLVDLGIKSTTMWPLLKENSKFQELFGTINELPTVFVFNKSQYKFVLSGNSAIDFIKLYKTKVEKKTDNEQCKKLIKESIMYLFDKKMHSHEDFESFIDERANDLTVKIKEWMDNKNITKDELHRLETEKYRLFSVDTPEDYLTLRWSCFRTLQDTMPMIPNMSEGDIREMEEVLLPQLVEISKTHI